MRASVLASFIDFSAKFEGICPWMYLDVKGLVTIAIGNLIDPAPLALSLPFMKGAVPATKAEIQAEWESVKKLQNMAKLGGGVFARVTKLRLTKDDVEKFVLRKLHEIESELKILYPEWEEWPADAQLGLLSLSWAAGVHAHFPKLEAAAEKQDWTICAHECHMDDTHNPGLTPRNVANVHLFQNAARVKAFGLDPSVLYHPGDATTTSESFQQPRVA